MFHLPPIFKMSFNLFKRLNIYEDTVYVADSYEKAGIIEFDFNSNKILSVNDSIVSITGYTKKELLSINPLDLLTEESRKIYTQRLNEIVPGNDNSQGTVYQIIDKKGDVKWVLFNSNITFQDGKVQKASVIITDITKLKQSENKLMEYQKKLKKLSFQLSRWKKRSGATWLLSCMIKSARNYLQPIYS